MGKQHQGWSISLTMVAVSLAALGLAASFGIPMFFAQPDITLRNACKLIASEVHATQSRAAWLRKPLRLVFEETGYRALDEEGRPVQRFLEKQMLGRSFLDAGIFDGVTIREIDFGGDRELAFSDHGSADTAGRLVVAFEDAECELTFEANTGRVRYRWPNDAP